MSTITSKGTVVTISYSSRLSVRRAIAEGGRPVAKTTIEWSDTVWNPTTGCTKIAAGCKHCYAKEMHRRLRAMGQPKYDHDFGEVRCHPGELEKPLHWRKPRRVFVDSMSDLFHPDVPSEFIAAVFGVMAATPQHTYQVLTKRPERARRWFEWYEGTSGAGASAHAALYEAAERLGRQRYLWAERIANQTPWPLPNVHLGYSASTQADLERGIGDLLATPAAVRWLSLEPLVGPVEWPFLRCGICGGRGTLPVGRHDQDWCAGSQCCGVDWLVVGCESGPNARTCELDWVRSIVEQCKAAGVPVFVKQLQIDGKLSKNPDEWPEDLRIRQYPEVPR
jgi:protein gp37